MCITKRAVDFTPYTEELHYSPPPFLNNSCSAFVDCLSKWKSFNYYPGPHLLSSGCVTETALVDGAQDTVEDWWDSYSTCCMLVVTVFWSAAQKIELSPPVSECVRGSFDNKFAHIIVNHKKLCPHVQQVSLVESHIHNIKNNKKNVIILNRDQEKRCRWTEDPGDLRQTAARGVTECICSLLWHMNKWLNNGCGPNM